MELFAKHIGEKAVREAADTAIERFGRLFFEIMDMKY